MLFWVLHLPDLCRFMCLLAQRQLYSMMLQYDLISKSIAKVSSCVVNELCCGSRRVKYRARYFLSNSGFISIIFHRFSVHTEVIVTS
jgi:hypothetical protein